MPTLMDIVQQNISAATKPAGTTDETQRARNLFAARGGRAVAPTQSAISGQAEQGANEQTGQALGALGQQVQLQQTGMVQQQQQTQQQGQQQQAQIQQQKQGQQQQARLQSQQILGDLERNRGQLNLDKDKAQLEQLGHVLAMQDKRYVAELQNVGRKQRLDSDLGFREELTRSVLGSNTDLLKRQLNGQSILNADRRAFTNEMSKMNMATALEIANNEMRDAARAGQYSAATSVATAGIAAAGKYQEGGFDSDYQAQRTDTETGKYSAYNANRQASPQPSGRAQGPTSSRERLS